MVIRRRVWVTKRPACLSTRRGASGCRGLFVVEAAGEVAYSPTRPDLVHDARGMVIKMPTPWMPRRFFGSRRRCFIASRGHDDTASRRFLASQAPAREKVCGTTPGDAKPTACVGIMIQAMTWASVPTSGAGTSLSGPMNGKISAAYRASTAAARHARAP